MSPYRLQQERGITNLDSISTGLSVVGTGTVVWLSGWDVSGDTTFKVASTYEWSLISKPTGSNAAPSSTNTQWTTFVPDVKGTY